MGGHFTAWDAYIEGTMLEMHPASRIVQLWRTTEFPEGSADSHLEVVLEPDREGTRLTLVHSAIPEGQGDQYAQAWQDHYFEPMRAYFSTSPAR